MLLAFAMKPSRSLTRLNPGNAHVRGLLRHEELVGSGELDGDQTAQETRVLPRFGPRDG
jgi:hypothetical protein